MALNTKRKIQEKKNNNNTKTTNNKRIPTTNQKT